MSRKKVRYAVDFTEEEKALIVVSARGGMKFADIAREHQTTVSVVEGLWKNAARHPNRITIRKFSWEGSHA